MKKLFVSLVALVMATMSNAQRNLVATLSHEGEVSVFHGANSLKEAMAAADHGDIITLASGRYNAVDITKAITLRGAGLEGNDTNTGASRTQIINNFSINIPNTSKNLTIEGIWHDGDITLLDLNNVTLQKCRFKNFYSAYYNNNYVNSLTCIHCKIRGSINLPLYTSSTAKLISCIVNNPRSSDNNQNGYMEFTNCIVLGNVANVYKSYFQNCILNVTDKLPSTTMASYCAGYTSDSSGSPFASLATQATNKTLTQEQLNAIFKDETSYELTDEAKAEYLGIDGTEMGLYGGNLPFETRILSPQITKCNVAAKTTADGKLSVDIEVKAAE